MGYSSSFLLPSLGKQSQLLPILTEVELGLQVGVEFDKKLQEAIDCGLHQGARKIQNLNKSPKNPLFKINYLTNSRMSVGALKQIN